MRSQPLNVVWFDDMLSQIEDVRESLQKHSVNVTAFDNADELRDHLTAVVRQGSTRVPDCFITDLKIIDLHGCNDREVTGPGLAKFVNGLYRRAFGAPGPVGAASAYADDVRDALGGEERLFAFAYDVSELGNGQFDHFVYDLRGERLRFRRDALCASYHRSHPFEFDDQGGKRRADVYYGRIAQFSGPYVCVEGWQFDARRSERVFWFEREMVDRVGEFESDEPVRIVCVEDLVSSNRVSRQYEMYKWEGLGLRTHIQLLPDEDFGCLDEQRA